MSAEKAGWGRGDGVCEKLRAYSRRLIHIHTHIHTHIYIYIYTHAHAWRGMGRLEATCGQGEPHTRPSKFPLQRRPEFAMLQIGRKGTAKLWSMTRSDRDVGGRVWSPAFC